MSESNNRVITINGAKFEIEDLYAEGHTVNENEASALNQTRAENIRNNFSTKVKAAIKEAGVKDGSDLDDDALTKLAEELGEYVASYEFGKRVAGTGGGSRSKDPVEKEMLNIARQTVRDAIKAKGIKISDVPGAKITELANGIIEKDEEGRIRAQAEEIVKRKQEAADVQIDLDGLELDD